MASCQRIRLDRCSERHHSAPSQSKTRQGPINSHVSEPTTITTEHSHPPSKTSHFWRFWCHKARPANKNSEPTCALAILVCRSTVRPCWFLMTESSLSLKWPNVSSTPFSKSLLSVTNSISTLILWAGELFIKERRRWHIVFLSESSSTELLFSVTVLTNSPTEDR